MTGEMQGRAGFAAGGILRVKSVWGVLHLLCGWFYSGLYFFFGFLVFFLFV